MRHDLANVERRADRDAQALASEMGWDVRRVTAGMTSAEALELLELHWYALGVLAVKR